MSEAFMRNNGNNTSNSSLSGAGTALSQPLDTDGGSMASLLQQQAQQLQGRRLPFGNMGNRRSSLGMAELALGDLFGRRASGFGEMDVLGRRGSLDSTSAVLDAAMMDLTRRRLSMAMGTMPGDPLLPDAFASVSGAYGSEALGLGGVGGIGALSSTSLAGGSASANSQAAALSQQAGTASARNNNDSSDANSRQKEIEEQQRDLERRQQELESQRQQLMAAMEERRRTMQQMQQKIGQVPATTPMQRNSLLGTFGGGLGASLTGGLGGSLASSLGGGLGSALNGGYGGGLGSSVGGALSGSLGAGGLGARGLASSAISGGASLEGLMGLGGRGLAAQAASSSLASTSTGSGGNPSQWIVCKICNSKAFNNLEEAAQHEAFCMAVQKGRQASLGLGVSPRRSSLDLLVGTLDRPEFARLAVPPARSDFASRADALSSVLAERRFSISGDVPAAAAPTATETAQLSNGPFAMMPQPLPLTMDSDKDWLTPLHCFVRRHCVQVFTATEKDVATPSKGKRKPIQVGQVGIRCPHCHHEDSSGARERGSVYYPTSIASIYNATMNLLQRHLHNCNAVPHDVMRRYETLKADDARSGTSKKYWVESALSLGLVDTTNGIRFSASTPPPLPGISRQQLSTGNFNTARRNSNEFFSTSSNAVTDGADGAQGMGSHVININSMSGTKGDLDASRDSKGKSDSAPSQSAGGKDAPQGGASGSNSAPLVTPMDEGYATAFSYHLLLQMQPCVFTEADRLGKRKGLPPGFPGLACRHCFGGYGSGRFFPSSIKTLSDTSKTLNVLHNHMMRCRKCPPEVRETLVALRKHHDEQRAKMKFGSQKAFFARIWDRLHFKDPNVTSKRKFKAAKGAPSPTPAFQGRAGVGLEAAMQQTPLDAALAMQQYSDALAKKQKLS